MLWSLGQGINSTKSVLFTLLGCLQMACRCRFDTRVLGTSGSSKSVLLFMQAHLHSAATCASAGFRSLIRSGADRLNVAGCRLLQITTIHNGNPRWSKGSRMLRCSQYMIRCHDLRCRHSYVLFPTLLPTDMNDVFLSNAWSHLWACTLTYECQIASGKRPKGDTSVG